MIIVVGGAHSQIVIKENGKALLNLQPKFYTAAFTAFKKNSVYAPVRPFIAPDYYSRHLGFFCKQEIKMDKAFKIPFRFRLGSMEQCNWLEGKRKL